MYKNLQLCQSQQDCLFHLIFPICLPASQSSKSPVCVILMLNARILAKKPRQNIVIHIVCTEGVTFVKKYKSFFIIAANAPSSGTSSPVKRKHVSHERENASKLFPRTTGGGGMSSSATSGSSSSTPNPADAAAAAAKKAAMLARLQAQSLQNAKEAKGSMDLLGSIMSEMKKN